MKHTIYVVNNVSLSEQLNEQLEGLDIRKLSLDEAGSTELPVEGNAILLDLTEYNEHEDMLLKKILELEGIIKGILYKNTFITIYNGKAKIWNAGELPGVRYCTHLPVNDTETFSILKKLIENNIDLGKCFPEKELGIHLSSPGKKCDPRIIFIYDVLSEEFLGIENTKLRQREKMTTDFIDMFSHDIGLPLTPLKMNIELMKDGEFGELSEVQKDTIEAMEKSVNKINKMRMESLLLNKLDSGIYRVNKTLTSIYTLLEEVMYQALPIADKKNLTIEIHSPHFSANVDPNKLRHVLDNLVSNAIKYTPEGGRIEISAEKGRDRFWMRVKDSGTGVPEGMEAKIFERFVRINKSIGEGTGLGLSIVLMIVEKHGGKVWYERPPDGGSMFVVELPRR